MARQINRILFDVFVVSGLGLLMNSCDGTGSSETERLQERHPADLTIFTYDSLAGKEGFATIAARRFEIVCGCRIRIISVGGAAQILSRIELDLERNRKPEAQVVLGLDQNLWKRSRDVFDRWKKLPAGYQKLSGVYRIERGFMPYNYSVFTLMSDTQKLKELGLKAPTRLDDLLKDRWRKKFILQDPRTSSPGLSFLLFSEYKFKRKFAHYWSFLRRQYLALAPSWDASYQLFLRGEAPLVWSYATSEAYHRLNGDLAGRYRAVRMTGGHPLQVEGAAVLKGISEKQRALGMQFLAFLLQRDIQAEIPQRNWMFPVIEGVDMPPIFHDLKKRFVGTEMKRNSGREIARGIRIWERAIEGLIDVGPASPSSSPKSDKWN